MDQLEQRYVLENQMVGGKSNQKRAGVYGLTPISGNYIKTLSLNSY